MSESSQAHSYCPAKWTYLSLKVDSGENHSCHYPPFHKVPLNEMKKDLGSVHNSSYKLKQRDKMLKGIRPKECSYCWSLEDKSLKSPRLIHLSEEKSFNDKNFSGYPKYLEVSFSKKCQMKCLYCNPQTSSAIYKEYNDFGAYLYEDFKRESTSGEKKQYSKLFWDWFPLAYPHLDNLRISGGEPFLSKELAKLLEYIDNNPRNGLKLSINSNLSLPLKTILPTLNSISKLIEDKKIFSCTYYTSLDSIGSAAEYIRFGINTSYVKDNIKYILDNTYSNIVIMNTFNLLNIPRLYKYLNQMSELGDQNRISVSFSTLAYPRFLSVNNAGAKEIELLELELEKIIKSDLDIKYSLAIRDILTSIKNTTQSSLSKKILKQEFYLFIKEYDKRKKTNFNNAFPQLAYLNKSQGFIVKALCQCKIHLYKLIKNIK